MKEIIIISGKGGTGKTSVTGAFSSLISNAVLADADVDAPDLFLLLNPSNQKVHSFSGGKAAEIDKSLCSECGKCKEVCRFNAITSDLSVNPLACEGCGVCVWNCPSDAINFNDRINGEWYQSSSKQGLPFIHAQLEPGEENSGKLVSLVRNEAKKVCEDKDFSLILTDGPPGTGCPVIASLGGADIALVVTEPTLSAIHDMKRVLELVKHFGVYPLVVINKYDLNYDLSGKIFNFCQENGIKIAGKIPYHTDILSAQKEGKSIIEYGNKQLIDIYKSIWDSVLKSLNYSN